MLATVSLALVIAMSPSASLPSQTVQRFRFVPPPANMGATLPLFSRNVAARGGPAFGNAPALRCAQGPGKYRGTGLIISGSLLAAQGLVSHVAYTTTAVASRHGPIGIIDFITIVSMLATYTTLAPALGLISGGTALRGRSNAYAAHCLGQRRATPRPALGWSLFGTGVALMAATGIGIPISNRTHVCWTCDMLTWHLASHTGLGLMFSGLPIATYALGYRRWLLGGRRR